MSSEDEQSADVSVDEEVSQEVSGDGSSEGGARRRGGGGSDAGSNSGGSEKEEDEDYGYDEYEDEDSDAGRVAQRRRKAKDSDDSGSDYSYYSGEEEEKAQLYQSKSGAGLEAPDNKKVNDPKAIHKPVTAPATETTNFMRKTLHAPPTTDSPEYKEALRQCMANKKKFEDTTFFGPSALGDTSSAADHANKNADAGAFAGCKWMRLGEFPARAERFDPTTFPLDKDDIRAWEACISKDGGTFYYNKVTKKTTWDKPAGWDKRPIYPVTLWDHADAGDIEQGNLGDCWFVASIAAVADAQGIDQIFMGDVKKGQVNEWGLYGIWLYFNGEWRSVIIDDRVPIYGQSTEQNPAPICAKTTDRNEIWVCLLEKAYAKLQRSYANIAGGWASQGIMNLTGGAGESIDLKQFQDKQDQVIPRLRAYLSLGAQVAVNSTTHCWTVLNAVQLPAPLNVGLIHVRNPWGAGDGNYTGPYSDTDRKSWDQVIQGKKLSAFLKYDPSKVDGEYWMPVNEFLKFYANINVCRNFSREQFAAAEYKGKGSQTIPLQVTLPKGQTSLNIALCAAREDWRSRGKGNGHKYMSNLRVTDARGNRLVERTASDLQLADISFTAPGTYYVSYNPCDDSTWTLRAFSHGTTKAIVLGEKTKPPAVKKNQEASTTVTTNQSTNRGGNNYKRGEHTGRSDPRSGSGSGSASGGASASASGSASASE